MTRVPMSEILGRGNVTKVPIIHQFDKFILKRSEKKRKKQGKRAPEKIRPPGSASGTVRKAAIGRTKINGLKRTNYFISVFPLELVNDYIDTDCIDDISMLV